MYLNIFLNSPLEIFINSAWMQYYGRCIHLIKLTYFVNLYTLLILIVLFSYIYLSDFFLDFDLLVYEEIASNILKFISDNFTANSGFLNPIFMYGILWGAFWVFISNLLGLLPYSSTLTSIFIFIAFFSICFFMLVISLGFVLNGWNFLTLFLPAGIPWYLAPLIIVIEFFSVSARLVSITMRLFANMMSGHTLLKVLLIFSWLLISSSVLNLLAVFGVFIPVICIITMLEFSIALIQGYVFLTLLSLYFKDTWSLH